MKFSRNKVNIKVQQGDLGNEAYEVYSRIADVIVNCSLGGADADDIYAALHNHVAIQIAKICDSLEEAEEFACNHLVKNVLTDLRFNWPTVKGIKEQPYHKNVIDLSELD